jgi:hypothetical protein
MPQQTMHENSYGNVYGTIATVIFAFMSRFHLADWAAAAAIFAGSTTGLYNIYRFYKDNKNKTP